MSAQESVYLSCPQDSLSLLMYVFDFYNRPRLLVPRSYWKETAFDVGYVSVQQKDCLVIG